MKRPFLLILILLLAIGLILSPSSAGAEQLRVSVSFSAVIIVGGLTVIIAFGVSRTAMKKDDKSIKLAKILKDSVTESGMIKLLRW